MTNEEETMAGIDPYEVETDADEGMEGSVWLLGLLFAVLARFTQTRGVTRDTKGA